MLYRLTLVAMISAVLAACGGGDSSTPPPAPATYEYFALGKPQVEVNVPRPQEPSTMIIGGGTYDVDSAFRWMIERSGVRPGTGGRLVILRAVRVEEDDYTSYIYYSGARQVTTEAPEPRWVGGASLGLTSVETLVVPDREAANHPFVNEIVGRANAVFISGGDQANYINYWKNTALHTTLNQVMARNAPIGGTSAGLAVLGQFDFAALKDGVSTAEALADPFNEFMTLDPDPLSLTGGFLTPDSFRNTILDSHFDKRDRMGRTIAFVSRLVAPVGTRGCPGGILAAGTSALNGARAIGVSEDTALLVEGDGVRKPFTARRATNPDVATDGAIYFVRPLQAPEVCAPGTPLTVRGVEVAKLADDRVFNLSEWSGVPTYTVDTVAGVLNRNPY